MTEKVVMAVVSDLHVGSKSGLHAPTAGVTDKYQRRLWFLWLEFTEQFRSLTTNIQGNSDGTVSRVVILNGDIVDMDWQNRSYDYHYTNPVNARAACIDVIAPLMEQADHAFFVRGTPSHVGTSGREEEAVARDWDQTVWKDKEQASWWELLVDFGGVLFDIQHTASMGKKPWTRHSTAARLATEIIMNASKEKRKPPDIAIRSHNHQYADSGRAQETRVIMTGCWQLKTGYAKRGEFPEPDIQGNIFICEKGKYEWLPQNYEIPTVTVRKQYPTLAKLTR